MVAKGALEDWESHRAGCSMEFETATAVFPMPGMDK